MNDLKSKIGDWIVKGGFPLEMKVARSFLESGYDVAQSVYFQDVESQKFRETDIIATRYVRVNNVWLHLTFVIECKKSNDKPWVVLKNDSLINFLEDNLPVYYTDNGKPFIESTKNWSGYKSQLLYKNSRSIGYSLQTAFNTGVDKSFEAIQSVTKACEYFTTKSNEKRKNVCSFYFPVILIEGELFEGRLLDDGNIDVNKVHKSEVIITRSFHQHGNSNILLFDDSEITKVPFELAELCDEFFSNYRELLVEKIMPNNS